ncbi:unnamed protein product [Closterium sp. NIES-53]
MAHLTHFTLQVHAEHASSPSLVAAAPSFLSASPSVLTLSQFLAAPHDRAVFLTAVRQPRDAASPSSSEYLIRDHATPRTATSAEPSAASPFGSDDSFRVAGEVVGCVRGNYGGTHFILASCTPRSTTTKNGTISSKPHGTVTSDGEMQRSSSYDDVTPSRSQRDAGDERGRARGRGRGGESGGRARSASGEEISPPRGGCKKADTPGKGGKAGRDSKSGKGFRRKKGRSLSHGDFLFARGLSHVDRASSSLAGGALIDGDARASENADAAPRQVASARAAFAPLLIGWLPAKGDRGGGNEGDDGARGWGGAGGVGGRGIGGLGAAGGWLTWNVRKGAGSARAKGDDEPTGDEQSESQEEASQREESQREESQRAVSQREGAERLTEKGRPHGAFGISWAQCGAGDYKGSASGSASAGANTSNALWRVFGGAQGSGEECASNEAAAPDKAALHGGGAQLWGSARWTARGRGGAADSFKGGAESFKGGAESLSASAFFRAIKGAGVRGNGAAGASGGGGGGGGGGWGGGVVASWGRASGDRRSGWAWVDAWGVGERGAGADEGTRSRAAGKADREWGDSGARREAEEKGGSGDLGWRKEAGAGEGDVEEGAEGKGVGSGQVEEWGMGTGEEGRRKKQEGQRVGMAGEGGSDVGSVADVSSGTDVGSGAHKAGEEQAGENKSSSVVQGTPWPEEEEGPAASEDSCCSGGSRESGGSGGDGGGGSVGAIDLVDSTEDTACSSGDDGGAGGAGGALLRMSASMPSLHTGHPSHHAHALVLPHTHPHAHVPAVVLGVQDAAAPHMRPSASFSGPLALPGVAAAAAAAAAPVAFKSGPLVVAALAGGGVAAGTSGNPRGNRSHRASAGRSSTGSSVSGSGSGSGSSSVQLAGKAEALIRFIASPAVAAPSAVPHGMPRLWTSSTNTSTSSSSGSGSCSGWVMECTLLAGLGRTAGQGGGEEGGGSGRGGSGGSKASQGTEQVRNVMLVAHVGGAAAAVAVAAHHSSGTAGAGAGVGREKRGSGGSSSSGGSSGAVLEVRLQSKAEGERVWGGEGAAGECVVRLVRMRGGRGEGSSGGEGTGQGRRVSAPGMLATAAATAGAAAAAVGASNAAATAAAAAAAAAAGEAAAAAAVGGGVYLLSLDTTAVSPLQALGMCVAWLDSAAARRPLV